MAHRPDVSVVIPCRNEAATIGACVQDARTALDEGGYSGEVVVCENTQFASADGFDRLRNNARDHELSPHDVQVLKGVLRQRRPK